MRGILFPTESATQAEVMAEAFASKSIWDLRWYKFKLMLYTVIAFAAGILGTTMIEWFFEVSLFEWFFGL
mgnify:CR=1 FL=1|tara:strand:+ start:5627 stop:5836 length:210 start_codon:yes stop_codon:yes gene_type:complete